MKTAAPKTSKTPTRLTAVVSPASSRAPGNRQQFRSAGNLAIQRRAGSLIQLDASADPNSELLQRDENPDAGPVPDAGPSLPGGVPQTPEPAPQLDPTVTPDTPDKKDDDTEPGWPPGKTGKSGYWSHMATFPLAAGICTDLLPHPEFAPKAPVVLNGYWIKDIYDVVRLISGKYSMLDTLEPLVQTGWPRIKAVTALVRDPVHFNFDTYLAGLSDEDKKAFMEPDPDHPGMSRPNAQVAEMKGFQAAAYARQWPTLLRPATPAAALPADQTKAICKTIADNRANVPVRSDLHTGKPAGDIYHQGLYHSLSKAQLQAGAEATPTNMTDANADRTRFNQLAWQELLTEGSAGSVNTYDSQLLTVGRGFGVSGGQGRDVLQNVFASDPLAKDLMLDVGFTVEAGKSLALDTTGCKVLSGDAALHAIELNKQIFSQYINTFEDNKDHQQEMVNAQFSVLRQHTADISDAELANIHNWNPMNIRFAIHMKHFASGFSWSNMIAQGQNDVQRLGRMVARYCSPNEQRGSATLLPGEQSRVLEWGEGALPAALPAAAALPADVEQQAAYYFQTGTKVYKRLNK